MMNKDEKNIKLLIDKYFEGSTSLKEEQSLRDYFQKENVPEEWKSYQAIFQFFSEAKNATNDADSVVPLAKTDKQSSLRFYSRISMVAAACLLLFFVSKFMQNTYRTLPDISLVYVDGKKYTDVKRIQTETLKSLDCLSAQSDPVYSSQIDALELFFE